MCFIYSSTVITKILTHLDVFEEKRWWGPMAPLPKASGQRRWFVIMTAAPDMISRFNEIEFLNFVIERI